MRCKCGHQRWMHVRTFQPRLEGGCTSHLCTCPAFELPPDREERLDVVKRELRSLESTHRELLGNVDPGAECLATLHSAIIQLRLYVESKS